MVTDRYHKDISTQYDLEITEQCPLCGEFINAYVSCSQGIIQQIHFQACKCDKLKDLCDNLEPLFKGAAIDDLYADYFIERVNGQLASSDVELRETGIRLSDKILYAFYNKYYT